MEDGTWLKEVIIMKYELLNPWIAKQYQFPSIFGIWKHLRAQLNSFRLNTSVAVGNGIKSSIWIDTWPGQSHQKEQYLTFFTVVQEYEATISIYRSDQG